MSLGRSDRLLFVLGAIFVTCLVVSDIIGGAKLVELGRVGDWPVVISVGMLAFPLTFVLTDLLNEFYGPRVARFVTYVGLGMLLVTFTILVVAGALPQAAHSPYPAEWFARIFGSSLRLIVASLTAYVVGQLLDIFVFATLKRWAGGRYIWLRATGSTVISQAVDTLVVQFINFGGVLPVEEIGSLAANSYVIKFVVALAMTPLIYLGHGLIGRVFGMRPLPVAPAAAEAKEGGP